MDVEMGVDINMTMGFGIHIPPEAFDPWLDAVDEDDDGAWEFLEIYMGDHHYSELTFELVENAWVGINHGVVILAKNTRKGFGMGRQAEAGVYRPGTGRLSVEAQRQLDEISLEITGETLPVEWLVTVRVS